jgi:hypothetical protein
MPEGDRPDLPCSDVGYRADRLGSCVSSRLADGLPRILAGLLADEYEREETAGVDHRPAGEAFGFSSAAGGEGLADAVVGGGW